MDISADVIKILQLGLPGLVFLLMLMSFKLITRSQNKDKPDPKVLKTIQLFISTNIAITLIVVGASVLDQVYVNEGIAETLEIKAVKANMTDTHVVAVCTSSSFKNRFMLLKDSNPEAGIVQVRSKGTIPCTGEDEELRLSSHLANQLGWQDKKEGVLTVDVAANGFKFDL